MCGILAALTPEATPLDLGPGLRALAHRGPDGQGQFSSPCGRLHLGHTRLALVDLAGGQQPFHSEDGQVSAVVNGEFYGDQGLRRALLGRGHALRSRCDSELLVHLYEDHGLDALRLLRGEFAFVLWDQRRRLLWAARDRFGIKPLVYTEHRGTLLLASEAKALLALGAPAAWDVEAFFQAASLQYLPPDRTLFDRIRTLPPGHQLLAGTGPLRVAPYWDMDYPYRNEEGDDEGLSAELGRRLDEAVELRLRGDEAVACQLSGGIDSAAVLAAAARASSRPVPAFTLSFEGGYDEADRAEEIARFVGAAHHRVDASAGALAGAFEAAVLAGEGLAINGHIAAKHLLLRAIREAGYKVALTGEGADEVLAGYAHLRADLAGTTRALEASNQASAGLMLPSGATLPLGAIEGALGFVPTWLQAKGSLGFRLHGLLRDEVRGQLRGHDPAATLLASFDVEGQLRGRGRVEQALYLWTRLALGGYILRTLGDAQEMAHGVEGRVPFLDHELFAWLRQVAMGHKIRDGVEKHLLRRSQRGRLPPSVLTREKHPLVAPPLDGPLLSLTNDLLRGPALRASPLFDPPRVLALLDALPRQPLEHRKLLDPVLYLILSSTVLTRGYALS
jgi:asparagine synthase (glutamine-hydrolysing)